MIVDSWLFPSSHVQQLAVSIYEDCRLRRFIDCRGLVDRPYMKHSLQSTNPRSGRATIGPSPELRSYHHMR